MSEKKVPYETIEKALQQDDSAIVEILLHYRGFMQKLAGQEIVKENGQRCRSFDEEMLLRLEVKADDQYFKVQISAGGRKRLA